MSKVQVVIKDPLLIEDAGTLDDLLQIVVGLGSEVTIKPVSETTGESSPKKSAPRRSSRSKSKAESTEKTTPPEQEKAKVEETPKVEPEEKPKAETKKSDPEPEEATPEGTGEAFTKEGLMEKFTDLVDKDYYSALALLEDFSVDTFHDLDPAEYGPFGEKLLAKLNEV